jgi:hypothetical protein
MNIKLDSHFVRLHANNGFSVFFSLPYFQTEVCFFWEYSETLKNYTFTQFTYDKKKDIWKSLDAGIAVIMLFINENITDDTEIKHISIDIDGNHSVKSKKNGDEKYKLSLQKKYSDETNAELLKGALQFYLLENILKKLHKPDIEKIGTGKIMLKSINLSIVTDNRKQGEAKQKDEKITELDYNLDYKLNFLDVNDIKYFFKSVEENGEKQIAVFYNITDCENVKQRIRKINRFRDPFNFDDTEKSLNYCSDWEITTIGNNKLIQDFAAHIAIYLSKYFNITEYAIREMKFNELFELCKTSS